MNKQTAKHTPGPKPFDPQDKEHKAMVIGAIVAADVLGAGRLSAVKDQLDMNDVTISPDDLRRYVFEWGRNI